MRYDKFDKIRITKKDLKDFLKIDKKVAHLPVDFYIPKQDNPFCKRAFGVYIDRNGVIVALIIGPHERILNDCKDVDEFEHDVVKDWLNIHWQTLSKYFICEIDDKSLLEKLSIRRPSQRTWQVANWCEFIDDDVFFIYEKAIKELNFKQACKVYLDMFRDSIAKCILWPDEDHYYYIWSWKIWRYLRFVLNKLKEEKDCSFEMLEEYFLNRIFREKNEIFETLTDIKRSMQINWNEDYEKLGDVEVNDVNINTPYNFDEILEKYIEFKKGIQKYFKGYFENEERHEFRRYTLCFWRKERG